MALSLPSIYSLKMPDGIRIAILDNCDYYGKGRIITRINTPEKFRGKGYGAQLLQEICRDADTPGVFLFLEISPSNGLDYGQLESWYLRYGFKPWLGIFRRKPQGEKA